MPRLTAAQGEVESALEGDPLKLAALRLAARALRPSASPQPTRKRRRK